MKYGRATGFGMLLLAAFGAAAAAAPSFDCSRAESADETAICADPALSALDRLVAAAYANYQPEFQPRGAVARQLLRDRKSCGGDTACIAAAQLNALSTYGGDAPWAEQLVSRLIAEKASAAAAGTAVSAEPPQTPAQCVRTRISEVATRLGDPLQGSAPGAGIYVAYENGAQITSYDRDDSFDGIAQGQEAVVCLVSIPRDCPAGDTRGRVYYTLDIGTGKSWSAPDSQHNCGGA